MDELIILEDSVYLIYSLIGFQQKMQTKFPSKIYNVEPNYHYLLQSQVNYVQKENLFKKTQDNDARNILYLTSPCPPHRYRLNNRQDLYKCSSVNDIKKQILLQNKQSYQPSGKHLYNSEDFLKNNSGPLFKERVNVQTRCESKKSRLSFNSSSSSVGSPFKNNSILQTSLYNRTNPYSIQNKQRKSFMNQGIIDEIVSKPYFEQSSKEEQSKQNMSENQQLLFKVKDIQKSPLKTKEVSPLRIKQNGPLYIRQISPLNTKSISQSRVKQPSPLKGSEVNSKLIHTRYPSSYAHLHENRTKDGNNMKLRFKNNPNTSRFAQKYSTIQQKKDKCVERLSLSLSKNTSSDSSVEYEAKITARFNFVQQETNQDKRVLQTSSTSIGQTMKCPEHRKVSLSQFIVGPCKGKGRYGKVYIVIDKLTGAVFAIKQISLQSINKMKEQFISEIKLQAFLNHPNITKVYGYFIENGNFYIIMEYMNEGCLYELIKKGPIPEKQTATKLKQVSKGLWQMHKNDFIHRDIKPQNIVMTFGVCKICDFSWVAKSNSQERRRTNCGTLDYLSPQVIQGNTYTSSIDLWSMGVLLYQMLVGKPPFYDGSMKETANKIKQCKFTFPPGLSVDSKSLILSFLRKDPTQRKEIDQMLKHSFFLQVQQ